MQHVLIANRGEIAIRIARAAAEAGYETTAVHAEDDVNSLHLGHCDHVVALPGTGPAAYLDIEAVLDAARQSGADAIHPGYGFLSENAAFGQAVADAGLTFIGPSPDALRVFGDKAEARALAERVGVPVVAGTKGATDHAEALAFMEGLGQGAAVMVKAVSGGGGRGM